MTDHTPKPESIPSNTQIEQWEASTAMALRVLRVLSEVVAYGEMASSGYLRKRCGLSAEEWHGSGELMAALICFASDKGFLEWHARDMVGATSDPKPEPSELDIHAFTVYRFIAETLGYPEDDGICHAAKLVSDGLADLEAKLAAATEELTELKRHMDRCDLADFQHMRSLRGANKKLKRKLAAAERDRDGWKESAAEHAGYELRAKRELDEAREFIAEDKERFTMWQLFLEHRLATEGGSDG